MTTPRPDGKPEILGLIPARGGSKGIPRKNVTPLAGRPLIAHTFASARQSAMLTRVVLTSDDPEALDLARQWRIDAPFVRPPELSGDNVPMVPVVRHALAALEAADGYRPRYLVILQPTSPLRTARHIDEALAKLVACGADSLVSVTPTAHNSIPETIMRLEGDHLFPFIPMDEAKHLRQARPTYYSRNGAIYACRAACVLQDGSLYGSRIAAYVMPPEASLDIDTPYDLHLASLLLTNPPFEPDAASRAPLESKQP